MKFRVTIEVEDIGDHPWVDGISDKIDDWTEKLVTDRLKGLKRATKGITKPPIRYKGMIQEVHVEREAEKPSLPRYLMRIDDKKKFLPIREAGVVFDSGWHDVEIYGLVLEGDGETVRAITPEERDKIRDIADEYSSSK